MLKQFMYVLEIGFFSIGAFTHLGRLIYLLFKPKILDKFTFITNTTPSKTHLMLYYVLVIGVLVYIIDSRLEELLK